MIDLRVFLTAALLGAVMIAGSGPAQAQPRWPSLYDQPVKGLTYRSACETRGDYLRLVKELRQRPRRHARAIDGVEGYMVDERWPFAKQMEHVRKRDQKLLANRELMKRLHEKSRYGYPLDVDCRAIPRKAFVLEQDTRPARSMLCIRVSGWPKCLWTWSSILERYRAAGDGKTFRPR